MRPEPDPESTVPGAHIWGWMSEAELLWLRDHAALMRSVVEVGSLRGRSAFALLTGCPGPVYCIDPWADPGDHAFTGFMESCGHFENVRPVRGESPSAGAQIDGPVDMVFIDGLHDYDHVKADVEYWTPRTQRLICGHDYSDPADYPPGVIAGYPDVHRLVHELFGDRVRLDDGTSIWYVEL